jgi:hypothetical protein
MKGHNGDIFANIELSHQEIAAMDTLRSVTAYNNSPKTLGTIHEEAEQATGMHYMLKHLLVLILWQTMVLPQ